MKTEEDPIPKSYTANQTPCRYPPADTGVVAGNGETSLIRLLNAAYNTCAEQLPKLATWRDDVTATLATISQRTAENNDGLRALTQVVTRVETQVAAHSRDAADISARLEAALARLSTATSVQDHNLEQVRLQVEALARTFEKLSQEVIARQVTAPLFVAFARLYEAVYALSSCEDVADENLRAILRQIINLLEDHNIELIHPNDGERVDPRRHQPVEKVLTTDETLHGRVARTFNVGLADGQRLIQPARVEVFILADAEPAKSLKS